MFPRGNSMEGLGRLKPGGLDGLLVSLLGGGLFGLVGFALGFFRITQTQALNEPVVLDLLQIEDERLEGNLGAGKTSLVRAMLRRLGFAGPVKSPTFSLVETYPVAGLTLNHFDFYRFEEPEEFEDAGFRDLFGPGFVSATEWTEKASPYVPDADLVIELALEGLGRRAVLKGLTPLGEALVAHVSEAGE